MHLHTEILQIIRAMHLRTEMFSQIALHHIELLRKHTSHKNRRVDSWTPHRGFQSEAKAAAQASSPCELLHPHYERARRATSLLLHPALLHPAILLQGDMAWAHQGGVTMLPRHIATA